jgi:PAS domain S-box-containing protein
MGYPSESGEAARLALPSSIANRSSIGRGLRRYSRLLAGAALVAGTAIALSWSGVRNVRQISSNASVITGEWLGRMNALAAVEDRVRSFRQLEAREALAATSADRAALARAVDSLVIMLSADVDQLRRESRDTTESDASAALHRTWQGYLSVRSGAIGSLGGPNSPAMNAFRAREPQFGSVSRALERVQAASSSRAARLAADSRTETRTVTAIVLASTVLTLLLIGAVLAFIRADRLRRRAEQRWQDVATTELGMVWETDRSDRFVFVSEQLCRSLGRSQAELIGRHSSEVIVEAERDSTTERYVRARSGQPFSDLELQAMRPDGRTVELAIAGVPIHDDDGRVTGYRGVAIDVTERRRAELAIARVQRLDSLGTLAGGIAHDFNNVLHAIGTYADLAGDALDAHHPARRDLQLIRDAGARGKRLVERILTFSRSRPTTVESVSLNIIVDEALALVRPTLPSTVTLEWNPNPDVAPVRADATELHQVVINLLSNAAYAMRELGGHLRVSAEPSRNAAGDETACLRVEDSGIGMSPEVMERIFEPFFTTKPQTDGTGIGLAMVHGIVTALGGTIAVTSTLARGTTFTVLLPVSRGEAALPLAAPTADQSADALAGRRVLLVDDDPLVLEAIGRLLTRAGVEVTAHANPNEALAAVQTARPDFDLVVSDISMPGMTGLELVSRLRSTHPRLPVILCTGYGGPDGPERAQSLGVHALLEKPVTARDLRSAISSALAA